MNMFSKSASRHTLRGTTSVQAPRVHGLRPLRPIGASTGPNIPVGITMPIIPDSPILGSNLVEMVRRFKRMQNGSDIRGVTIRGVPHEPVTMTAGGAFFIGHAFAEYLINRGHDAPVVSVGKDPRLSGGMVETALAAGLAAGGASVHMIGLATTPCMFYSIVADDPATYQGAIMITASHMPFNSNGLKFFTAEGGADKNDISEILQRAAVACSKAAVQLGEPLSEQPYIVASALATDSSKISKVDFRPRYATFLRELIKRGVQHKSTYHFPLSGYKIVVDAGNGAGGFFADEVLSPLGADVTGSQFLDPDGSFPNHVPNPEHPSAMEAGSKAVLANGADLGIVFDTDVDRSAVVDGTGKEISSNRFIALMAAIILREHPGTTIVTDSVTSNGLAEFIANLGGIHCRYKRGYKNVIGKGIELNNEGEETHLMMETSGHGATKENYFLDDGAYLAVKAVIEMVRLKEAGGGGLGDILADLKEPLEAKEFRIRIRASSIPNQFNYDFKSIGAEVLDIFQTWVVAGVNREGSKWSMDEVNHEGWRVNIDEGNGKRGWALLRQSLHDPLLVLNIESEVEGGLQDTKEKILAFFKSECSNQPLELDSLM